MSWRDGGGCCQSQVSGGDDWSGAVVGEYLEWHWNGRAMLRLSMACEQSEMMVVDCVVWR